MLKTRCKTLLLSALLAAAVSPVSLAAKTTDAGSPSHAGAEVARDNLKRFADGVRTFEAHFEQTQTDDHGEVTNRSSGAFWLARPAAGNADAAGRFRWAYEKPYEQLTVCDGSKLWSYDPDLEQVTVRDARQALNGTPAALLSQRTVLSDAFSLQDAGAEGDLRVVRLVPRSKDSDFKSIELALNGDGAPVRMRFADQIGGHSEVSFSGIRTNQSIDPVQFQFTPPKGAEVVDGDAAPRSKGK
jgi:outer membrane lipoprotein carrier protein